MLVFSAFLLLAGFLGAPILTIVLRPFWNWFETVSGIESLGHAMPATWCFLAVYVLFVAVGLAVRGWVLTRTRRRPPPS